MPDEVIIDALYLRTKADIFLHWSRSLLKYSDAILERVFEYALQYILW